MDSWSLWTCRYRQRCLRQYGLDFGKSIAVESMYQREATSVSASHMDKWVKQLFNPMPSVKVAPLKALDVVCHSLLFTPHYICHTFQPVSLLGRRPPAQELPDKVLRINTVIPKAPVPHGPSQLILI